MAKGRKTSKPKQQSYQKITREADTLGVYAVLDEATDRFAKELKAEGCRIALAWKYGWKKNKDGQLVLGKCSKVSELNKEYAAYDFVIVLNNEAWKELDDAQRLALVHHELCHAAVSYDQNGNVKKDARNRTCFRVRKHDIEEFGDVINAHGCYKQDLENFVATAMRSKKPPSPSLLDTVLEDEDRPLHAQPSESVEAREVEPEPAASAARIRKRPAPKSRGKARGKARAR